MNPLIHALRRLARSPGYAAAAVLTFAVGIGASTAMFSLIHAALLRPLPYDAPERLAHFRDHYVPTGGSGGIRTANFMDLRRDVRSAELAAYEVTSFNTAAGDRPERAPGLRVTSNFPATLGVSPVIGRTFMQDEDLAGRPDVVLISHRIWRDRFDGAADVIGETVLLDAKPHDVVGVLPRDFWFPGDPELIVPFAFTPEQIEERGSRWLDAIARLQPGATVGQLDAELNTVFAAIRERFPEGNTDWTIRSTPFGEWALGSSRSSLLLLNGAVLLLLLIGSVNVANLMLVRAERRSRETAVRVALGAGRGRIAAQHVGESLLLAAAGAVLGIALAAPATRALVALFGGSLPRVSDVTTSLPVMFFATGLALAVGLLVGLVPALRTNTTDVYDTLRQSGRGGAFRRSLLQQSLVAAQVALAVVLVSGAALLVHSFIRLNAVDTGLDLSNAMVFSTQLPAAAYDSREKTGAFFDEALERIHALPGVRSAGVSERTPLQGGFNVTTIESPLDPEITASFVELRGISPAFFTAAGIPLLQGRGISDDDIRAERRVVVINDELSRTLFGERDPIGEHMLKEWDPEGRGFEVVGVVGSVREFGITNAKRPGMYFPLQMVTGRANSMVFVVRTDGDPMAVVPGIRNVITQIDPTLPIHNVRTMRDVVTQTIGARWLATNLFTAFGLIALVLAAFGIFAVLAYVVEQRTRDIGIRMALGATQSNVRVMIVAQGLKLAAVGLVIGLVATVIGSSLIADLLWQVEPTHAGTLALAAAVALATAGLAALLPAVRATRIMPAIALTSE